MLGVAGMEARPAACAPTRVLSLSVTLLSSEALWSELAPPWGSSPGAGSGLGGGESGSGAEVGRGAERDIWSRDGIPRRSRVSVGERDAAV